MNTSRPPARRQLIVRDRKGPKYDHPKISADPDPHISDADSQLLARLVRKYGRDTVIAVVSTTSPNKLGRPSRGLLPYFERMHLAQWIEEAADEHRKNGSKQPVLDAEIELYDLMYSGEKDPPDFQKWQRTVKRKRFEGKRDLREYQQKLDRYSRSRRRG